MKRGLIKMESELEDAIKEIRNIVLKITKSGKKINGETNDIINNCQLYFDALKKYTDFQTGPTSFEDNKIILEKLYGDGVCDGFDKENFQEIIHRGENGYKTYFYPKKFYSEYISDDFSTNPSILKIFPYLLAAYYLNMNEKFLESEVIHSLFKKEEYEYDEENRYRNVNRFVKCFSLENYIEDFCKKKKSDKVKEIRNITSKEMYIQHLSHCYPICDSDIFSIKETNSPLQWECLHQALIYSMCVLACFHSKYSSQVDYKISFDLFDKHTAAFQTMYPFAGDKNGNIHPIQLITYLKSEYKFHYITYELHKMLCMNEGGESEWDNFSRDEYAILKQCGVNYCDLKDWKPYGSADWYINMAIMTIVILHPCRLPGWLQVKWKQSRSKIDGLEFEISENDSSYNNEIY